MAAEKRGSRLPGFYNQPLSERRRLLAELTHLSDEDLDALDGLAGLAAEQADHMVENVVGVYALPLGIALNFVVNGREILVPMAIEEPSVVAGASYMAKLARLGGGFYAHTTPPEMIGQIQILGVSDLPTARIALLEKKDELLAEAAEIDPLLKRLGGGPRDLQVRLISESPIGPFLVLHLIYGVRDAMGANAINTAAERLAPHLEAITGGRVSANGGAGVTIGSGRGRLGRQEGPGGGKPRAPPAPTPAGVVGSRPPNREPHLLRARPRRRGPRRHHPRARARPAPAPAARSR